MKLVSSAHVECTFRRKGLEGGEGLLQEALMSARMGGGGGWRGHRRGPGGVKGSRRGRWTRNGHENLGIACVFEESADTHTMTIYTEAEINHKMAPNWP